MKGIELSRLFFEEYGRDMIEKEFSEYRDRLAAGLVGQGSERYAYDDESSADHDFCAGFCIFTDSQTEKEICFELMSAYRKLPKEFMGVKTKENTRSTGSKYGVVTYDGFFEPLLGRNYKSLTASDYMNIPQNYLADATNGEIFYDPSGTFTAIYNSIKYGMPEDVRLKRMSANLAAMAQSGQYNYARCLGHGEEGAAVLALCEFVKSACAFIYLFNKRYMPYYKWMLKGVRDLEKLGELSHGLEFLLTADNDGKTRITKCEIVEDIAFNVAEALKKDGLSDSDSDYLEDHARSVLTRISDVNLRNMHILCGAEF